MRDFIGNEIVIGDEVIYMAPGYKKLTIGKVAKITKYGFTMEKITDNDWEGTVNRPSSMCIKYNPDNKAVSNEIQ